MKNLIIFLAFVCLATVASAQAGSALNVTGICVGSGTPNVAAQNTTNQTQLVECSIYKDSLTADIYIYDPSLSAGSRWVLQSAHAPVTVSDGTNIDFTLTGQNVAAKLTDGTVSGQTWNWNGAAWVAGLPAVQDLTISGTTNPVINLADNDGNPDGGGSFQITGSRGITAVNTAGVIDVALPSGTNGQLLVSNGTAWIATTNPDASPLPVYVSNAAAVAAIGTGKKYRVGLGSTENSVGTVMESY